MLKANDEPAVSHIILDYLIGPLWHKLTSLEDLRSFKIATPFVQSMHAQYNGFPNVEEHSFSELDREWGGLWGTNLREKYLWREWFTI